MALHQTLNVLLVHISLPPFGSLLLCTFVLVRFLVCVFVFGGDTYTSSSAILSTHMQLALKFSYKKNIKKLN